MNELLRMDKKRKKGYQDFRCFCEKLRGGDM